MRLSLCVSLAVALGLSTLHAKPLPPPPVITLDPAAWVINWPEWTKHNDLFWSFGMPAHPDGNGASIWFDFPHGGVNCPSSGTSYIECGPHYFRFQFKGSIASKTSIGFTATNLNRGGTPWMNPNTGTEQPSGLPAGVRVMLGTADDTDFGRWWSADAMLLDAFDTPTTIATDLNDPAKWSSVYGHRADSSPEALAGFTYAKSHLTEIDLTFGGEFYGHGVDVLYGDARFVLAALATVP